ncbi:glycosyltransferase family 2 protein [Methanoplanus endosymbiosus]|uniref:Glycosyltransferase family 2 protein n=1 Tax=Methanoplanus endosymbiosus TaxID=33865 RepID=A0A9E7TJG3_9EURY|nr:glycosyltransferase family 2 protein [Methanoplanus endosymbiosus]UUX91814.1 glycosyltransferase family 2 protein [Methanoplanus endosymbiosus]
MYKERKIGVVVPAYNEELLIGPTLETMPEFVDRIYVVDDCSTDNTAECIDESAQKDSRILNIRHETNSGVGASIITGYKAALADDMDIIAVMAGDNQMDPTFLPELLNPIVTERADYTVGNRLINEKFRANMSRWRFAGNATLTLLTKIASGYWQMMDPQNGYTAISKRALETIPLSQIYTRYGYCNDLLIKLNVFGFRVINVPHPARYGLEKSGIKYSSYIVKVSWLLFSGFLWRMKNKYVLMSFHPLVFFYFFGSVFTILGFLGGLVSLYEKFILMNNVLFVHGGLALLVFMLGMMFVLFAMLFDMQQERTGGWY